MPLRRLIERFRPRQPTGSMKIIVGLGNPGRQYERTPHNAGFEVVEELARRWGGGFSVKRREQADIAETRIGSEAVVLARPLTYMNLSGQAVREILRNRPAEIEDLLVVCDDFNLELGRLRIRDAGSAGGQNGLKSIIGCLGTEAFPRLRVGVAPDRPMGNRSAFVLGKLKPDEREKLDRMVRLAADAAEIWAREGVEAAANRFNGLREE